MYKQIQKFLSNYKADLNSRYRSYDHCRIFFNKNIDTKNYDEMALHLYSYLSSWGMLRNSFLMQKDYKFHINLIKILCDKKYRHLLNYDPKNSLNIDDDVKLIIELKNQIKNFYINKSYFSNFGDIRIIKNVTDALVSKILLGTFGCVPAYDTYFKNGLRSNNMPATFNSFGLKQIFNFAAQNYDDINKIIKQNNLDPTIYTALKIIDMYFWEKGMEAK